MFSWTYICSLPSKGTHKLVSREPLNDSGLRPWNRYIKKKRRNIFIRYKTVYKKNIRLYVKWYSLIHISNDIWSTKDVKLELFKLKDLIKFYYTLLVLIVTTTTGKLNINTSLAFL